MSDLPYCCWRMNFKGEGCGYRGPETSCDGTLETCRHYGNSHRYGTFTPPPATDKDVKEARERFAKEVPAMIPVNDGVKSVLSACREIKFRAWNEHDKTMIYIDDLYWFEENGVREVKDGTGEGFYGEKYRIMMSTGLKDKKGQDIYEGDVVTFVELFSARVFIDPYRGVCVRYLSDNARARLIDSREEPMPRNHTITVEVVGNIYEHPELLTGGAS